MSDVIDENWESTKERGRKLRKLWQDGALRTDELHVLLDYYCLDVEEL